MIDQEIQYRLLKMVEEKPDITQRELAEHLGVSLGKANYCVKALIERGWVKIGNFRRNPDKRAYTYLLTPSGVRGKAQVTARFLRSKMEEYETLRHEIKKLQDEVRRKQGAE